MNEDGRAACVIGLEDRLETPYQTDIFSAISGGREHVCGLENGGAVLCWGSNGLGESNPPGGAFSSLAAGKRHNCALRPDGEAVCWGNDKDGRATPPPGARFAAIAAGGAHSCGIAESGDLICWGQNQHGQSESRDGPFSALALGDNHTCALRPGGDAFCQGRDDYGQASPPSATAFSRIAAGEKQSCGITPNGGLECWGIMPISDHSQKFAAVGVGYGRACALNAEGAAKCWLNWPAGGDPLGGAWLERPVEMFPMPNGGLAVVDQRGYIELYPPDGGSPRTALDLTERTACCGDFRGMLSAALDPDFDRFPFIYIYWQTNEDVADADNDEPFEARVSRFPVADGGAIDADGELVIMRLRQRPWGFHFAGSVRFGPDGMLYLGLGDKGEFKEPGDDDIHPAADLSSLAGKIIRIDIRGAAEGEPYRVPPDNPFLDTPGARPEIWAYGLRNPWRMSFAPNGDLIVADAGKNKRQQEVTIAERGANLGWPVFEGSLCYTGYEENERLCDEVDAAGYTFPVFEYSNADGDCAIVGGMNARGGEYIFGDYCSGRVRALERTAPDVWSAAEIMGVSNPILAFGSDADGAVYALRALSPVSKASE